MTDDLQIEREIIVELSSDEVWRLAGTAEGWQQWLVDSATVDLVTGGQGEVVDDGVRRQVHVTEVDGDGRITFRWWERDDPSSVSEVVIDVTPHSDGGSRVLIVERPLTATALAARGDVWDLRLCLLALSLLTLVRV